MNVRVEYFKNRVQYLAFLAFMVAIAVTGSKAYAQSNPTKTEQIINALNSLVENKKLIYKDSEFGDHPIVLMDSGNELGSYLEPEQTKFRPRALSKYEFDHALRVLPTDSTYSFESFDPTGEPLLVIQVCEQCLVQKYSQLPDGLRNTYLSPQGIAAITFNVHLHAYEQRNWKNSDDADLNVIRQEGTAFFAESKVLGLLLSGSQKLYDYAFHHLKSVQEFYEDDQTRKYYIIPALNLLVAEHASRRDSIVQITEHPRSIDLTNSSVLTLKNLSK